MFADFGKALEQVFDPAFRRVLIRSILLTLVLLGPFVFGFSAFLQWIVPDHVWLPFIGEVTFIDNLTSGIGLVVALFLSSFLMIPVAGAFMGLFLEDIADAVEARYYPQLEDQPGTPILSAIWDAIRFFGLFIVVNLIALIIYFLSTLLAPVIFWVVNGILIGREFFQLAAMRRLGRAKADRLRKKNRLQIWVAGMVMAVPLTIPILNLVIPILGVATFTHMFHRLNGDQAVNLRQ